MPHTPDWSDFRFFLQLARTGNLSATARKLGVEHTTVARRIAQLEERLGCSLFNRRRNGYALTEVGESFVAHAEAMEGAWLAALAERGIGTHGASGTVRIGTPEGVGICVIVPRLAQLYEAHPALRVELLPMPHFPNIAAREVDIIITLEAPTAGHLVVSRYSRLDYKLFGSVEYLSKRSTPASRGDLAQHDFVDYVQDMLMSPQLRYLTQVTPHPHRRFTSTSMIAQRDAVISGLGMAMLTPYVAGERADLVPVLPGDVRISLTLWIAAPAELLKLRRVRAVWDFLRGIVQDEPDLFVFDVA